MIKMKVKEKIFKGLALSGLVTLFASCATLQTAQQPFPDDVYGRDAEPIIVAENVQTQNNNEYTEEYRGEESYGDYSDGYLDGLSYANRISRFYYGTPGLPYYDPWISHWDMFSPFGSSFYFGLGFGHSWYNPYFGYSSLGWGRPYYGSYWGPYSYYGGGYGGYYGGYPAYGTSREVRTRPSNLGTDNVVRSTRPSRNTINTGRSATSSRTAISGDRLQRTRSTVNGSARPTSVENARGSNTRTTRPSATQRPTRTEEVSRPAPTRQQPQARPAPSRPSYTPSSSSSPSRPSSSGSSSGRTRSR